MFYEKELFYLKIPTFTKKIDGNIINGANEQSAKTFCKNTLAQNDYENNGKLHSLKS